jgi:3D (Asp-Asp-Asp) domain-containing protein
VRQYQDAHEHIADAQRERGLQRMRVDPRRHVTVRDELAHRPADRTARGMRRGEVIACLRADAVLGERSGDIRSGQAQQIEHHDRAADLTMRRVPPHRSKGPGKRRARERQPATIDAEGRWLRNDQFVCILLIAGSVCDDASARGCSLNTARTASGTVAGPGTVAVDTRVFRFGTRFFIPGYGYGRATDTGGYIRGQHIDLAMRSCSRALAWGSRTVMVSYAAP